MCLNDLRLLRMFIKLLFSILEWQVIQQVYNADNSRGVSAVYNTQKALHYNCTASK